ncbi:MAG: dodecin domain-containing protein [Firmicutes bacterium]|nr:dodecin domain-containing protein [Bacillota bacterium]
MSVAKIIELIGASDLSWEDAVQDAVQKASETVEGITGVEVQNFTANVENDEVIEYKANVKLAFEVLENR